MSVQSNMHIIGNCSNKSSAHFPGIPRRLDDSTEKPKVRKGGLQVKTNKLILMNIMYANPIGDEVNKGG